MSAQPSAALRERAAIPVPSRFLYAKLRARRAALYEGERLLALADALDIQDLAARLFPHESLRDQFELELRIQAACVAELCSLGRFVSGAEAGLYQAVLERYRVENLKALLRVFRPGENGQNASGADLVELPECCCLPERRLLESADVAQFVERIPMPLVRDAARETMPFNERQGRKAFLEMAFDKGYWTGVGQAHARLSASDRRASGMPLRCEYDAMRLVAVLRAAWVYDLSWDAFGPLLPDGWGVLARERLRQLFHAPEVGNVRDALGRFGRACRDALSDEEIRQITPLEELLWHETARLAERQFHRARSGFAVLVGYFYLKHEELRHLLSLTQMIRRGMERRRIVRYLEQ